MKSSPSHRRVGVERAIRQGLPEGLGAPQGTRLKLRPSLLEAVMDSGFPPAIAEVRLPNFFSDHMVLQQSKPINIWGWAKPGEAVPAN